MKILKWPLAVLWYIFRPLALVIYWAWIIMLCIVCLGGKAWFEDAAKEVSNIANALEERQ